MNSVIGKTKLVNGEPESVAIEKCPLCGGWVNTIGHGAVELKAHYFAEIIAECRCMQCGFAQEGMTANDAIINFRNACVIINKTVDIVKQQINRNAL